MDFTSTRERLNKDLERSSDDSTRAAALHRLGKFLYSVGLNIWCLEQNRELILDDSLPGVTDDNFPEFFSSIPEDSSAVGFFREAEVPLDRSLSLYRSLGDPVHEGEVQRDRALLFDKLSLWSDWQAAMDGALAAYRKAGDKQGQAIIQSDFAHAAAFREMDFPKAFEFLAFAESLYREAGNTMGRAVSLSHLADLHDPSRLDGQFGDLQLCEIYFNEAADLFTQAREFDAVVKTYGKLSQIFGEQGNPTKEEEYFLKAIRLVEEELPPEHLSYNYEMASEFFEGRGDKTRAAEYRALAEKHR